MDPKITLLFMLIGSVIGLSRLNDTSLDRVRRQLAGRHWREFMPRRRKVKANLSQASAIVSIFPLRSTASAAAVG